MTARSFAVRAAALCAAAFMLSGCLAVAATGAVVGVAGAAVGATAKGAGMVVGAVIPGDGDDDKRER